MSTLTTSSTKPSASPESITKDGVVIRVGDDGVTTTFFPPVTFFPSSQRSSSQATGSSTKTTLSTTLSVATVTSTLEASPSPEETQPVTVTFVQTLVQTFEATSTPPPPVPTTDTTPKSEVSASSDGGISKGGIAALVLVPLIVATLVAAWFMLKRGKRRGSIKVEDAVAYGGKSNEVGKDSPTSDLQPGSGPMFSVAAVETTRKNSRKEKGLGHRWPLSLNPAFKDHSSVPNSPSLVSPMSSVITSAPPNVFSPTNGNNREENLLTSPTGTNFATLAEPTSRSIQEEPLSATHLVLHPEEPYAPLNLPPNHPLALIPHPVEQKPRRRRSSATAASSGNKRRSASVGALSHYRSDQNQQQLKNQKSFSESVFVDMYAEPEEFQEDADMTRKQKRNGMRPVRRSSELDNSAVAVVPETVAAAPPASAFRRRMTSASDGLEEFVENRKSSFEEKMKKHASLYTLDAGTIGTRRTRASRRISEWDVEEEEVVIFEDDVPPAVPEKDGRVY
ncbi:hypothetical protein HDU97_006739 [Phlyctochytrium planicorne]|nr:hypothetical protein HDU97_006739 [Phlyctochytrium planicorne]